MTFETIEDAFLFVSSAAYGEHVAVVSRTTGQAYFASIVAGLNELPDDVDESDDYIRIPHKNDLDLGKPLVMEFVQLRLPEEIDRVHAIMKRRGAYRYYKELLEQKNQLEAWYAFENERTKEALLEWCKENGVEF